MKKHHDAPYGAGELIDTGHRCGNLRERMSRPATHESATPGPTLFALSLGEYGRQARETRQAQISVERPIDASPPQNPYASQWHLLTPEQRAVVGLNPHVHPDSYAAVTSATEAAASPFSVRNFPSFE
jgi:hypothetical protein